jgi:signal transduction histidine kinase
LDRSGEALETAMTAVREVSNELHSNLVERSGLPMAVERLVDGARERTNASITLEISSEKRYPPELSGAVFRVLEEILENALRHANANTINVRVHSGPDMLTVEVADDGAGFDVSAKQGAGLLLAERRAAAANLKFVIESVAGQGTIVKIQTS